MLLNRMNVNSEIQQYHVVCITQAIMVKKMD